MNVCSYVKVGKESVSVISLLDDKNTAKDFDKSKVKLSELGVSRYSCISVCDDKWPKA